MMFICQLLSRPNESGIRQVHVTDSEWDYGNDVMNWNRAMSFIPNWGIVWVRVVNGNVIISYGI